MDPESFDGKRVLTKHDEIYDIVMVDGVLRGDYISRWRPRLSPLALSREGGFVGYAIEVHEIAEIVPTYEPPEMRLRPVMIGDRLIHRKEGYQITVAGVRLKANGRPAVLTKPEGGKWIPLNRFRPALDR